MPQSDSQIRTLPPEPPPLLFWGTIHRALLARPLLKTLPPPPVRQSQPIKMSSNGFRFGLFEFDPERRELRREGLLVRLQSQPAQVLSCLLSIPAG
jgi:hypothetical protein